MGKDWPFRRDGFLTMSFQRFPALVATGECQDGEIGGCRKKDYLIVRGCVGWLRLDTGLDLF